MVCREQELLHARLAVPLHLFHLAGGDIDLKRSEESDPALPVFFRDAVVPWRQRDPEPALLIRRESGSRGLSLLHLEGGVRQGSKIGNALGDGSTRNAVQNN